MKITKGMQVAWSDGWKGKVEQVRGDSVICYQDGTVPNDWLHGCRVFSRSMAKGLAVTGGILTVKWAAKSASRSAAPSAPVVDIERARRERAALEAGWRAVAL